MRENIDWESIMTKTVRGATRAALNAERAVGGVAKMLEIQSRHSLQLSALRATLEDIASRPSCHPSQMAPPADNAQGEVKISFRYLALGFAIALGVGLGSGAYFAS